MASSIDGKPISGSAVSLVGEIIDLSCYLQVGKHGDERFGTLRLVASRDGAEGSVQIQQDVAMYASVLRPGEKVTHELEEGRHAWIQVVRGALLVDGTELAEGDGVSFSSTSAIQIESVGDSELLLFDLA